MGWGFLVRRANASFVKPTLYNLSRMICLMFLIDAIKHNVESFLAATKKIFKTMRNKVKTKILDKYCKLLCTMYMKVPWDCNLCYFKITS